MSIADERALIATAANTVVGVNVRARPTVRTPKPGDGWVVLDSLAVAGFRTVRARWQVVVVVGTDRVRSEEDLETLGVAVLDAVTGQVACADVELRPEELLTEQGGALYGFVMQFTSEV